jgi:uncharacterized membrane-anchored protein
MTDRVLRAPKVPEVFVLFWVVKLLTTGIGEAGADYLGTVSIPLAAVLGIGGFFLALRLQLRAESYHPVRYWVTVLSVALFGTMVADGPHVVLGTPYYVDSVVYVALLTGLLLWRVGLDAVIAFWASYVLTRPLGASVADWLGKAPSTGGLGWGDGTVFGLGLALFAALVAYLAGTHADVEGAHRPHVPAEAVALAPEAHAVSPDTEPEREPDCLLD